MLIKLPTIHRSLNVIQVHAPIGDIRMSKKYFTFRYIRSVETNEKGGIRLYRRTVTSKLTTVAMILILDARSESQNRLVQFCLENDFIVADIHSNSPNATILLEVVC